MKNNFKNSKTLILQLAHKFINNSVNAKTKATEEFCSLYNERQLGHFFNDIYSISRRTLETWQKQFAQNKFKELLKTKKTNNIGKSAMNKPHNLNFALAHIYYFPHAGPTHIYRGLEARLQLENSLNDLPSLRRVQAWYANWRSNNVELFNYISNPDKWKNIFRVSYGDLDGLILRLNQEWEMDSTPSDLILNDGKRHTIVACLDIYSRRVKFHVSKTSSSHAVATCLRKAILDFGVPEVVRTDNGADYIFKHIQHVMLDMNIVHDVCDPFSPEQKPFVERIFKSFLHDYLELMPGFTGHNVAERRDIEARKSFAKRLMTKNETVELNISPDELQALCDAWADNTYMHRNHSKLTCTPYEKAKSYQGLVRKVENENVLYGLFLPLPDGHGFRTVSKKGIRLFNDNYIAPALALWTGSQVKVRIDDADYSHIYVFDEDDNFICQAKGVKYAGLNGLQVQAIIKQAKALKAYSLRTQKASMQNMAKSLNISQIGYERIKADQERAVKIEQQEPMRANTISHTTKALTTLDLAINVNKIEIINSHAEYIQNARNKAKETLANKAEPWLPNTDIGKYRLYKQLNEKIKNQEKLPDEQINWLNNFEKTNIYISFKMAEQASLATRKAA